MKIKVNRKQVPIEFGKLKYTYDLTLETKERLETAQEVLNNYTEDNFNSVADIKEALSVAYNSLLGAGAFEDIYNEYPDVEALANSLVELTEELQKEVTKLAKVEALKAKK